MSTDKLGKIISGMNFQYLGTGQHKINIETFLEKENAILLDVRTIEEAETVKLLLKHPLTVLEIPLHELPSRMSELPKDKFIGVFCSNGIRSAIAFAYLKSVGNENVKIIKGGYSEFMEAILPEKLFKHLER